MRTGSSRWGVAFGICSAALALACASEGDSDDDASNGGSGGTSGQGGSAGLTSGGTMGAGTAGTSPGGSGGAAGSAAGAGGTAGGAGLGAGGAGSAGIAGTAGGAGASGAAGNAGAGGAAGAAGSSGAGSGAGGAAAGASGAGGVAGGGGIIGVGGMAGSSAGTAGAGGATACAGHAVSLSANGTGSASDSAFANVEINLGSDLPTGNAQRTFEFWAFIKTTDWVGENNELYYYGGSGTAAAFGMDFGTNPVMGAPTNHATLNPFTGGGFNDDSTNDLGITSSSDQWVHLAMVWNATNLVTYVNGLPKITTSGSGATALATATSVLVMGCNPSNSRCFNGYFDELRVWNVARSAADLLANYKKGLVGNESGLVGYWKFDEASGTTTADAVTTAGHTKHNGTLKADTAAHNPTFVTPAMPLMLTCP